MKKVMGFEENKKIEVKIPNKIKKPPIKAICEKQKKSSCTTEKLILNIFAFENLKSF